MIEYLTEFRVVGEIADFLVIENPTRRLLIDVSREMPRQEENPTWKYPNRTTLTIEDDRLVEELPSMLSPGMRVEARGHFAQSSYVPHKTTHIDTTFFVSALNILSQSAFPRGERQLSMTEPACGLLH